MTDNEPATGSTGLPPDKSGPPQAGKGQVSRQLAEAAVKAEDLQVAIPLTPEEVQVLNYELRVHQIELEMQNDELRTIQEQLETSRARYFDLYDLAPVGYFTLHERGLILEGNLTAAGLLGVERSLLINRLLSHFILPEDQDIYYKHHKRLSGTSIPQVCELRMLREGKETFWARLEATAAQDETGAPIFRVVMTDVTRHHEAAEEIARLALFPSENPNPVLRATHDGMLLYANAAASPLLSFWATKPGARLPEAPWRQGTSKLAISPITQLDVVCGARIFSLTYTLVPDTAYINIYGQDVTERRHAENALHESERKYRELVENANSIILRLDTEGRILFFNEYAQRFFDYTEEEILGKSVMGTIVPNMESTGRDLTVHLQTIMQDPNAFANNENENITKDGRRVWIAWTNKAILDDAGEYMGWLAIGTDITDRKRTEEALQASELRFRELANLLPQAVYEADTQGLLTFVNKQACIEFGYTEEEFSGMPILQMLSPHDVERGQERLRVILHSASSATGQQYNVVRKDGSTFPALVYSTPMVRDGKPVGLRGLVINITERLAQEESLRASQHIAWGILNASQDGALLLDLHGIILGANEAATQISGIIHSDLINRNIIDILPLEHITSFLTQLEQVISTRAPQHLEELFNGRICINTIKPILNDAGKVSRLAIFQHDVTDLRHAEDTARLATVGQLAAGVAHEFNNLLAAMMMRAELLGYKPIDPEARALVDAVLKSGRRGAEICKNLMSFARPTEPQSEPTYIEAALEASLAVAAPQLKSAGIAVQRDYDPASQRIHVDSGQLEQVFLNLIINARHAMPEGGTLSLSTHYDLPTNQVIITVADTGHGITPEHLPHIFEPFFTTKGRLGESATPGSGLGLSVSHGIITAHYGELTVRSTVDVGTTFKIQLPLVPDNLQVAAQLQDEIIVHLEDCNVLVMDDEPSFRELLSCALNQCSIRVVEAATVEAALKALATENFHLVLADVWMPDGGAAELLSALALQPTMPPVLVISGVALNTTREAFMTLGALDCIQKPPSLAEMVRLVEEYLSKCQRQASQKPTPDIMPTLAPVTYSRILLADDEASIRLPIVEALQNLGHTVVAVPGASEAIAALASEHFDLIISDLMMPGGGARRILEVLDESGSKIPVLIITGQLEQYIVDELLASGAAFCLQKPFDFACLLDLVAELLLRPK